MCIIEYRGNRRCQCATIAQTATDISPSPRGEGGVRGNWAHVVSTGSESLRLRPGFLVPVRGDRRPRKYLHLIRNHRIWHRCLIEDAKPFLGRELEGGGANALLRHRSPFGAVFADCAFSLIIGPQRQQQTCRPKPYRIISVFPTRQTSAAYEYPTLRRELEPRWACRGCLGNAKGGWRGR